MKRINASSVLGLVGVLILTIGATPASGNIRDSKGNFVFKGRHLENPTPDGEPTLPINVAFRGGSPATVGKVAFHVSHGFAGWGKRSAFKNPLCAGARYVVYPSANRNPANERYAAPAMHGTNNPSCLKQRHARFFSDYQHSDQFEHQSEGNFMLAQFHRETVVRNFGFRLKQFKHKVNESSAHSRYVMLKRMSSGDGVAHKVQYNWIVHPEATGMFNNKPHDLTIGRVSLAHR